MMPSPKDRQMARDVLDDLDWMQKTSRDHIRSTSNWMVAVIITGTSVLFIVAAVAARL